CRQPNRSAAPADGRFCEPCLSAVARSVIPPSIAAAPKLSPRFFLQTILLKTLLALAVLCAAAGAHATQKAYKVLVKKSEQKLYLLDRDRVPFKTFHVVFGPNVRGGPKQRDGDERTPEGMY